VVVPLDHAVLRVVVVADALTPVPLDVRVVQQEIAQLRALQPQLVLDESDPPLVESAVVPLGVRDEPVQVALVLVRYERVVDVLDALLPLRRHHPYDGPRQILLLRPAEERGEVPQETLHRRGYLGSKHGEEERGFSESATMTRDFDS